MFGDLTDARLPSTLAVRLQDINEITFHPSVHLGSYLSFILSPPRGIIFFNAQRFMERQREGQRSVAPDLIPVADQSQELEPGMVPWLDLIGSEPESLIPAEVIDPLGTLGMSRTPPTILTPTR